MDSNQNLFTTDQIIFKTKTFGGFEKKDVLSYVDSLRQSNKENMLAIEEKMKEMSTAREELEAKVSDFEGKVSAMEGELSKKSEQISALYSTIDQLKSDISENEEMFGQKDKIIKEQSEENMHLGKKLQFMEDKARRYEDISVKVGDIIIAAQKSADDVMIKAHQSAKEIEQDAFCTVSNTYLEIQGIKSDIIDFKTGLEQVVTSLNSKLNAIDRTICEVEKKLLENKKSLATGETKQQCGLEAEPCVTGEVDVKDEEIPVAQPAGEAKTILSCQYADKKCVKQPKTAHNTASLSTTIKNLFDAKTW